VKFHVGFSDVLIQSIYKFVVYKLLFNSFSDGLRQLELPSVKNNEGFLSELIDFLSTVRFKYS